MQQYTSVAVIIEAFYRLRVEHGGPKRHPRARVSKAMIGAAYDYSCWCAKHAVDAVCFMRARFAHVSSASGSRAWPKIETLKSESALVAWHGWREGESLEERATDRRMAESQGACTDPTLAQRVRHYAVITSGLMHLRRRYRDESREHLCEQDRHFTGGYDPRDAACRTCPRKATCLAKLNREAGFDVGALRAGVLGTLPEQVRLAVDTLDPINRARLARAA